MAISISKYVDITSGVGGAGAVRIRDLIGRLFTANPLVPLDTIVEVTSADDAATYFGSSSEEYLRAAFYFSFISKSITAPKKLQFARWAQVASEPRIYGARLTSSLADLQTIAGGALTITSGETTAEFTGLDFSSATSLADVASTLQTTLRLGAGQFATCTVTYNATSGGFDFVGSTAEAAAMSVDASGIYADIGWAAAVFSPGVDATSLVDTLVASTDASTNFGSFLFLPALTEAEHVEVAEWNATRNVEFMYCLRVTDADYASLSAALIGTAGHQMTYAPTAGEYDEMLPMIILAATDYSRRNAAQNYMFQQIGGLTAKVTTNDTAVLFDLARVNYYGVTQTAGQFIAFYQRGVMGGGSTAVVDQNTYANEMWLKDTARANILSLLLSVGRVPANANGRGQIISILQTAIDDALFNGVISVDKPITTSQKLYITDITGDDRAWHQVNGAGYWVDADVQSFVTEDGRTEYKIVYTLLYAKDDAVRKVEGSHILV